MSDHKLEIDATFSIHVITETIMITQIIDCIEIVSSIASFEPHVLQSLTINLIDFLICWLTPVITAFTLKL